MNRLRNACILLSILLVALVCASAAAEQDESEALEPLGTEMPRLELAYDFYYFWSGGHGALHNRNVYDQRILAEEMWKGGRPRSWSLSWYPYPPWSFFYFMPFGLLPFKIARVVWFCCCVAGFLGAVLWCRRSSFGRTLLGPTTLPRLLSLVLLYPPVLRFLLLGQSTFIVLLGMFGYLSFARRGRELLAGLLLSVSFLKFHELLPFYSAVMVHHLYRKQWRVLLGAAAGVALQTGVVMIFFPDVIQRFIEFWFVYGKDIAAVPVSVTKVLANLTGIDSLQVILPVVGLFAGAAFGISSKFSLERALIYLLPVCLLCAAYSWVHSSLLLLFNYLYCAQHLGRRYPLATTSFIALQFGYFLFLYSESIPEAYGPWIPLVLLLATAAASIVARPAGP